MTGPWRNRVGGMRPRGPLYGGGPAATQLRVPRRVCELAQLDVDFVLAMQRACQWDVASRPQPLYEILNAARKTLLLANRAKKRRDE